jgi:hypothetical protein
VIFRATSTASATWNSACRSDFVSFDILRKYAALRSERRSYTTSPIKHFRFIGDRDSARLSRGCSLAHFPERRATYRAPAGYHASRFVMLTRKYGFSFSAGSIVNSCEVFFGS